MAVNRHLSLLQVCLQDYQVHCRYISTFLYCTLEKWDYYCCDRPTPTRN